MVSPGIELEPTVDPHERVYTTDPGIPGVLVDAGNCLVRQRMEYLPGRCGP
jgi:hypothetical protein